jgi:glutathionyl-hydroquinone reductase
LIINREQENAGEKTVVVLRFEVFTAVTMKHAVFWDMALCRYFVCYIAGCLDWHSFYSYLLTLVHRSQISYTLKMEEIRSFETSVNKISTLRHIPEDGILQLWSIWIYYLSTQLK